MKVNPVGNRAVYDGTDCGSNCFKKQASTCTSVRRKWFPACRPPPPPGVDLVSTNHLTTSNTCSVASFWGQPMYTGTKMWKPFCEMMWVAAVHLKLFLIYCKAQVRSPTCSVAKFAFSMGLIPFPPPNQQCRSSEGKNRPHDHWSLTEKIMSVIAIISHSVARWP